MNRDHRVRNSKLDVVVVDLSVFLAKHRASERRRRAECPALNVDSKVCLSTTMNRCAACPVQATTPAVSHLVRALKLLPSLPLALPSGSCTAEREAVGSVSRLLGMPPFWVLAAD